MLGQRRRRWPIIVKLTATTIFIVLFRRCRWRIFAALGEGLFN